VPAKPISNAVLRLLVVEADDPATVRTALLVHPLDAVMSCASDSEVRRINRVRDIEAVVLFVPVAGPTLDNLDARPRLGWLPPHSSVTGALVAILRREPLREHLCDLLGRTQVLAPDVPTVG